MDSKIEPVAHRVRPANSGRQSNRQWAFYTDAQDIKFYRSRTDEDGGPYAVEPLYTEAALLAAEQRGRDAERDIAVSAAIKAIKASVVSVAKGPFMDEELPAAATLIKKVVAAIRKGDAT